MASSQEIKSLRDRTGIFGFSTATLYGYNSSMDRIAIILVSYNSSQDTTECLESLSGIKQRTFEHKVFVVDNGSKDPYVLAKRFSAKQFEVVRSESNLGFTGGNNMGISYVKREYKPDYILLLNNDTTVHPLFLEEMLARAQSNVKTGIVGAKIYFSKGREFHKNSYTADEIGKVLWFAGGSIDWQHVVAFHRGVDEVDRGHFDSQTGTDFITGCAMLVPTSVFERVGLLDEQYFVYMEDVEFSQRVKRAGYALELCQSAVVWHKNAGSSGGAGSPVSLYYQNRNRLYFGWQYGEFSTKLAVLRIAWSIVKSGSALERKAVLDAFMGTMGKQPIF